MARFGPLVRKSGRATGQAALPIPTPLPGNPTSRYRRNLKLSTLVVTDPEALQKYLAENEHFYGAFFCMVEKSHLGVLLEFSKVALAVFVK